MLDPSADHEREDNENDQALLAWHQNKYCQQPLHSVA
jgi:hypothetical protein